MNFLKTLYSCEKTEYDIAYTPDVVFAHRETGDLTLQVLSPVRPDLPQPKQNYYNPIAEKFRRWHSEGGQPLDGGRPADTPKFPLIVGCPGSGWAGADGHIYVPKMVSLVKRGFVVASISYRGTYRDNVVFPAAVQDLREAVRYMRANAEVYHIDPDRVGLIGDSSGGNTVAMAALAGDEALGFPGLKFDIGEHLDISSAVQACCCVYGPVELLSLVDDRIAEHKILRPEEVPGLPFEAMEIWQETYVSDPEKYLKAASPYFYVEDGKKLPPFLYIQGEEDPIIPMAQGIKLTRRLRECGGRAEMIKVVGAKHGTGVWSEEMLNTVVDFFKATL